jgi:protein SCO1/2
MTVIGTIYFRACTNETKPALWRVFFMLKKLIKPYFYAKQWSMFGRNKYTLLSLVIICGMFGIIQAYYDPDVNLIKHMMGKTALQEGHGEPRIGGEFVMQTADGAEFTEKDLQGHYSLVFFGYTFCPDICPMTLSIIEEAYSALTKEQQDMLDVLMVTVDPKRDEGESLGEYVTAFHEDFIGIRGTLEQTKNMADKFLVYYTKSGEGEDYLMDHSGYIYVMGPDGKYIHHFSHKDTSTDILSTLQSLLQK